MSETVETTPVPEAEKPKSMPRRGFKSVEQVEKEGIAAGEVPPTDPVAAAKDIAPLDLELPKEPDPEPPPAGAEPVPTEEPPKEEVPKAAGKYKIGDRTFATQEEAFAYAEELDRAQLAADAFRQGVEVAKTQPVSNTPPAPHVPKEMPTEYYTDPDSYLKRREQEIEARILERVQQASVVSEKAKSTWEKFYTDYPDLNKSQARRNIVKKHFEENYEALKAVDTTKALKIIADKARSELRELGVSELPRQTLPQDTRPAASPGGPAGVTRPREETKPLNFVEQMKQNKRDKAQARLRK